MAVVKHGVKNYTKTYDTHNNNTTRPKPLHFCDSTLFYSATLCQSNLLFSYIFMQEHTTILYLISMQIFFCLINFHLKLIKRQTTLILYIYEYDSVYIYSTIVI